MSDGNRYSENPGSSYSESDQRARTSYSDKYNRREDKDTRYSEDYDRRRRADRNDYDRRDRHDDRRSGGNRRDEDRGTTRGRDYDDDRRSSRRDVDDRNSGKSDKDVDDRYEQRYSSSRQRDRSRSRSRSPVYRSSANKSDSSSSTNVSSKPSGIQLKLVSTASVSAVKPVNAPKPLPAKVASIFNDDDDEPEEMPPEAKMRMKNIGRETPTSAGPNSFGKTKMGFCNYNQIVEKNTKL